VVKNWKKNTNQLRKDQHTAKYKKVIIMNSYCYNVT